MKLGVHPPFGNTRRMRVHEMADGEYRTIAVPGGPYRHDPGRSLWMSPPNSRAIEHMFIDRVIAVRTRR